MSCLSVSVNYVVLVLRLAILYVIPITMTEVVVLSRFPRMRVAHGFGQGPDER